MARSLDPTAQRRRYLSAEKDSVTELKKPMRYICVTSIRMPVPTWNYFDRARRIACTYPRPKTGC